jgi:hypothetical protein
MSKISRALDKFRARYAGKVIVGEKAVNVTGAFSSTKSRMMQASFKQGMQVYALPLRNGKGMLGKWRLDKRGKMVRGPDGKPIIKQGRTRLRQRSFAPQNARTLEATSLLLGKRTPLKAFQGRKHCQFLRVLA